MSREKIDRMEREVNPALLQTFFPRFFKIDPPILSRNKATSDKVWLVLGMTGIIEIYRVSTHGEPEEDR